VRFTPTLTFVLDAVPETAKHIDELLSAAAQADARVQQARQGAVPAGDADPYRKPRVIEDEADGTDGSGELER
jgi:ribosome-binding factor A